MSPTICEKFFGKKVCDKSITIEGINTPIPFSVYDGYACAEFQGHTYDMEYPRLDAVKACEDIANGIIEYCKGIAIPNKPTDVKDITVIHVMVTYNTLYVDGKEWFNE